jgi:sporulation protein YlmC with PRC-barrel domain
MSTFGRLQVRPGMAVAQRGGQHIGQVGETHTEDFIIQRDSGDEVCVPYDSVRAIIGDEVVLSLLEEEVGTRAD